jgi:hypothetical protein
MKTALITTLFMLMSLQGTLAQAEARANSWLEIQKEFEQAEIPAPQDLHMTTWTCLNAPTFAENQEFVLYMFKFVVVPHNNNIIFSNDASVTEWVPRWFARYQGMRTSIPFETDNFVDQCNSKVSDCIKTGTGMRNFGYLRLTREGVLYVEWATTTVLDKLKVTPISRDTEEKLQSTWMYSRCHPTKE